jgi:hypothetical protein
MKTGQRSQISNFTMTVIYLLLVVITIQGEAEFKYNSTQLTIIFYSLVNSIYFSILLGIIIILLLFIYYYYLLYYLLYSLIILIHIHIVNYYYLLLHFNYYYYYYFYLLIN